ncbi:terminal uridylyltransferase Tailor-like [Drosophila subpulchrella]|uniref:terminal uridylyltransferase Tailor-like n=1 Tax=Drosophila subpulchrella TaxID=1486046 RepID=UPI0018A16469|nr:terminal uridylyltransferase Tailor-like [Drosophila subpulchrella]
MDRETRRFWFSLLNKERRANKLQNNGKLHQKITSELVATLRPEFRSELIQINLFGSRILCLAGPDSDLDIYVDIDNSSTIYSLTVTDKVLHEEEVITKALQNNRSMWAFLKKSGGKCPVIVVRHKNSNVQCDINFTNSLTYGQNKLVIYIFELQPVARLMVIYLRGWAEKHQIKSVFRSHLLVLMVIFFLQVRGYLPSVFQLQRGINPDIGPWITTFCKLKLSDFKMMKIPLNADQTHKKLAEFFSYYSTFNFSRIICPYLGREVWRSKLKYSMPQRCRQFVGQKIFANSPVAMQDLVHLAFNKGASIQQSDLDGFLQKCRSETYGFFNL